MALTFLAFSAFVAVAAVVSRVKTSARAAMLQHVQQAVLLLAAIGFGQTGLIFYSLPLVTLTALVWSLGCFSARGPIATARSGFLWLVIWSAFALALLAKMGLNARIVHYGFYLSLPATVLTVVRSPGCFRADRELERCGAGRTFRTVALIGLAAAIAPYLTISATRYRERIGANRVGRRPLLRERPAGVLAGRGGSRGTGELATHPVPRSPSCLKA